MSLYASAPVRLPNENAAKSSPQAAWSWLADAIPGASTVIDPSAAPTKRLTLRTQVLTLRDFVQKFERSVQMTRLARAIMGRGSR